jgi:plastocyanin
MKTVRTGLAIVALVIGAALAACGGDDDESGSPSPGGASSASQTRAASPASEGTTSGESGVIEVEASEYAFTPDNFEVQSGEPVTVKVEATGTTIHTLTVYEDQERTTAIPGADVTVSPEQSGEFTVTFEEPGTLYFFCGIHPTQMQGEITVR